MSSTSSSHTESHAPNDRERVVREPLVSVVIPARNEENSIADCLESVLAQDLAELQVIVVDGTSEDATVEVVRRYLARDPGIEIVRNAAANIPSSLNVALRAARGRWLVRVDAHSTVPPDYVRRAVEHLSSGEWGGVGGQKQAVGVTPAGRAIAAVLASRLGVGASMYHHGRTMRTVDHIPFGAYRTTLLREVGGWDERVRANEDFEMDHRLRERGHRLLFDPTLRISWRCRQSLPDLFRQYRRYGRGKAIVALLHPESLKERHVAPAAFVATIVVATVTGKRKLLAPLLALYAGYVGLASVWLLPRLDDGRARRWVWAVFPAMHIGYGVGFWEGLIGAPARLRRPRHGAQGAVGPPSEPASPTS